MAKPEAADLVIDAEAPAPATEHRPLHNEAAWKPLVSYEVGDCGDISQLAFVVNPEDVALDPHVTSLNRVESHPARPLAVAFLGHLRTRHGALDYR